jgi:hypothetical protein
MLEAVAIPSTCPDCRGETTSKEIPVQAFYFEKEPDDIMSMQMWECQCGWKRGLQVLRDGRLVDTAFTA